MSEYLDELAQDAIDHMGGVWAWKPSDVDEVVRFVAARVERDVVRRVETLIGQCIEDEVLCTKSKRAAIMHRNGALLDLRVRLVRDGSASLK